MSEIIWLPSILLMNKLGLREGKNLLQGQRWSPRLLTPCLMLFLLHSLTPKTISLGYLKTWSLGKGQFIPQTGLIDGTHSSSQPFIFMLSLPECNRKPLPTDWHPFPHSQHGQTCGFCSPGLQFQFPKINI